MTTLSTSITIKLATHGKNWRNWSKQLINCASADSAFKVLEGSAHPTFDATDSRYNLTALFWPDYQQGATPNDIINETKRVATLNKAITPINDDVRTQKKEDELCYNQWVACNAYLQNTILSSIDKPLVAQVRMCTTTNDMYKALKDLNSNGDHANAAAAWEAFVNLLADAQPSVRTLIGKFREVVNDLSMQNIFIDWQKPLTTGGALTSRLEELLIIHFLHGLTRVLPTWVEACNNDLRQGHTWSIYTLIALLEDHIRHTSEEPVKSFLTVAKQDEEKRVLSCINNRGTNSNSNSTPAALSLLICNSNNQQRTPAVATMCDHCMKEHVGANKKCWSAHPELMPVNVKKCYAENAAKKAAQTAAATSRANVSLAPADDDSNGPFGTHVYTSIASFVSPILLQKAIGKQEYKQRYCYDITPRICRRSW
jgi:hypothetical protein